MPDEIAELKKEFELERMILFSDAVFAIAITLLIIEIKFPEIEKNASSHDILHAFKPVMVRFLGFMLSFFFIGILWARHLEIFKYLRAYNKGVIARNLVFIFFIVCFPFSASGLAEYSKPGFVLPMFIYIVNIGLVSLAQFFLCRYIYVSRPLLSLPGFAAEKKYIVLQSKYSTVMLMTTIGIVALIAWFSNGEYKYAVLGFYAMPIMLVFAKRRLKKFKPEKKELAEP